MHLHLSGRDQRAHRGADIGGDLGELGCCARGAATAGAAALGGV